MKKNFAWVFGSTGAVGAAVSNALQSEYETILFARNNKQSGPGVFNLDLKNHEGSTQIYAELFNRNPPDVLVFCTRFREEKNVNDFEHFRKSVDVELISAWNCLEFLYASLSAVGKPVSVIFFSSHAADYYNNDIPLSYHLVKSLVNNFVTIGSQRYADRNIRLNCIILGEFEKFPRPASNPVKEHTFLSIERFSLGRRLCNLGDIVSLVKFLASPSSCYVTGQLISMSGSLNSLSIEAYLRTESHGKL